jgi:ketosteroid isomerase-like protein
MRTASGGAALTVRFMTLWRKEDDGRWRIFRDYVTPDEIGGQ